MLAVSFGAYAVTLFIGDDAWSGWDNVFASLVIVVMTLVNMIGTTFVARAASVMVVVLPVCLRGLHRRDDLGCQLGSPGIQRLPVVLEDHRQYRVDVLRVPRLRGDDVHGRQPPRSRAPAAESRGARAGLDDGHIRLDLDRRLGTLTVNQAIGYGETAIAEAARPTLGDAGFTLMAVAALIATAGATNGTLFGSASLTGFLAELGQFPPLLGTRSRLGKHGGLLVTSILALVLAQLRRPLRDRLGRQCVLACRLLARRAAGYRLRANTGASVAIVLLGTR